VLATDVQVVLHLLVDVIDDCSNAIVVISPLYLVDQVTAGKNKNNGWSVILIDIYPILHKMNVLSSSVSLSESQNAQAAYAVSDDGSLDDELSLYELLRDVVRAFDKALDDELGWAWNHMDIAIHLSNTSTQLLHWEGGVHLAITKSNIGDVPVNPAITVRDLLYDLEKKDNYLASVIRSYLDDVRIVLSSLQALQTDMTKDDPEWVKQD
jgi:hypothetical protein